MNHREIDQTFDEIRQWVDEACQQAAARAGPEAAIELLEHATEVIEDWTANLPSKRARNDRQAEPDVREITQ